MSFREDYDTVNDMVWIRKVRQRGAADVANHVGPDQLFAGKNHDAFVDEGAAEPREES